MERLLPIGSQGFPELLNRLGIQPPLVAPFWFLKNTIQPVSLVDQEVDITVISSPVFFGGLPASAGSLANPAANAILADTGPLPAGNYDFHFWISLISTTTNNGLIFLERRDAANAVNIFGVGVANIVAPDSVNIQFKAAFPLQQNERVRLRNVNALAATSNANGTIWSQRR